MQTVLVVDDERVIREGCRRLLAPEGYEVITAENGREALDLVSADSPDLILCDLVMPVMGALEVLETVRAEYPDLPLVIITGHGTVVDAVEAMQKGAFDFVTKPFRAEHLIVVVKRALERRTLELRARELQEARARNLYDLSVERTRTRTIINCMAEGVLVTNRDMEVVLHNPALAELFECREPIEEPCPLKRCVVDEGLESDLRTVLATCCRKATQISREFCQSAKYLRAVSAPIPGGDDEVLGTVTVFQDVTAFRQLNEMKSNFVQLVSHELRAPLASIQQLLTVVIDGAAGALAEKQKHLLGRAQLNIGSLLDLITDLLDVSRIENGHVLLQRLPVNLAEVLEHLVMLMNPRAESRNIVLRLALPEEPPVVKADPRSMEELFSNLLSNAINYSPDGGEVVISAVPCGNSIEVCVKDTGVGIAPEEITKIFDKHYRIKDPKTRHVRGSGLGLSIVKGIVDSHCGSVEVESEPGSGSTFRVLLPTLVKEE
ncbi:MAG: response regulator [Syntrophobacteraceae bacterium]